MHEAVGLEICSNSTNHTLQRKLRNYMYLNSCYKQLSKIKASTVLLCEITGDV